MNRVDVSRLNRVFNVGGPDYIIVSNEDCERFQIKPIISNNSTFQFEKKDTIMLIKKDDEILYEKKKDQSYDYDIKRIRELLDSIEKKRTLKLQDKREEYQNLIRYQHELKLKITKEYNEKKELEIQIIRDEIYENNNTSYGPKNYNKIVDDLIQDLIEEKGKLIKQNESKTKSELKIEYAFNDYNKILKKRSYEKYKIFSVRPT
jgi:hypothetical protein